MSTCSQGKLPALKENRKEFKKEINKRTVFIYPAISHNRFFYYK
ncbi:hypothetical protein RV01_GL002427 [Enterococcus dispar]|nr:hypothetical protein RV01_GL002427 [Enterococcus dispar]